MRAATTVVTAVRTYTPPRASQRTASLYPGIAGPTLLVNLPALLGAIVKLFTPLFPKQARHRGVSPTRSTAAVVSRRETGDAANEIWQGPDINNIIREYTNTH